MAHYAGAQKAGSSQKAQAAGLAIIRLTAGAFLFFMGIRKAAWLLDSSPLASQLSQWLAAATPLNRWYLERVMPGVPVFARLVPLGEIAGGLALFLGFWTRLVAGLVFLMVLNFQLAGGAMFKVA